MASECICRSIRSSRTHCASCAATTARGELAGSAASSCSEKKKTREGGQRRWWRRLQIESLNRPPRAPRCASARARRRRALARCYRRGEGGAESRGCGARARHRAGGARRRARRRRACSRRCASKCCSGHNTQVLSRLMSPPSRRRSAVALRATKVALPRVGAHADLEGDDCAGKTERQRPFSARVDVLALRRELLHDRHATAEEADKPREEPECAAARDGGGIIR